LSAKIHTARGTTESESVQQEEIHTCTPASSGVVGSEVDQDVMKLWIKHCWTIELRQRMHVWWLFAGVTMLCSGRQVVGMVVMATLQRTCIGDDADLSVSQ